MKETLEQVMGVFRYTQKQRVGLITVPHSGSWWVRDGLNNDTGPYSTELQALEWIACVRNVSEPAPIERAKDEFIEAYGDWFQSVQCNGKDHYRESVMFNKWQSLQQLRGERS